MNKPTPEQFRDEALKRFQLLAKPKFDKGQLEHGGNIVDRILFDEMEKEIVDLWYYVQAAKWKFYNQHPFDEV